MAKLTDKEKAFIVDCKDYLEANDLDGFFNQLIKNGVEQIEISHIKQFLRKSGIDLGETVVAEDFIKGITLLSIEEAEKIPRNIRNIDIWWWLRTPGFYQLNTAIVSSSGSINNVGDRVHSDKYYVRPALICENLKSFDFKLYQEVECIGESWIYIGDSMLLHSDNIGQHIFDSKSNDYNKSEIKKYLEDWLNKKLQE